MRQTLSVAVTTALALCIAGCSGGGSPLPSTGNLQSSQSAPVHVVQTATPGPIVTSVASPIGTVAPGTTPAPHPSAIATNLPSSQPTAVASSAPTTAPLPTARPTAAATPVPTAAPTAPASASPGIAALLCVHFAANPMCRPLPSNPSVSPQSAAWAALDFQAGRNAFGGLGLSNAPIPFNDPNDDTEPFEELVPGAATIAQTIVCDIESWGPGLCTSTHVQGRTIDVPADMMPEGNGDHHYSFDDPLAGGEYDFWLAQMPQAAGATMNVGGAGFCAWGGDGTGCSGSTATNIVTSLGGLDATSIASAELVQDGTLPYAIASAALCADSTFVYPATSSDGFNTNTSPACAGHTGPGQRPPEGTRWFLDQTDAQIDALAVPAYDKVILRTMDRQHFGGLIVDTNWSGAPGLSPEYHRGNYAFAAAEAGIPYGLDVSLPISTAGLNLANDIVFCTNGTC